MFLLDLKLRWVISEIKLPFTYRSKSRASLSSAFVRLLLIKKIWMITMIKTEKLILAFPRLCLWQEPDKSMSWDQKICVYICYYTQYINIHRPTFYFIYLGVHSVVVYWKYMKGGVIGEQAHQPKLICHILAVQPEQCPKVFFHLVEELPIQSSI